MQRNVPKSVVPSLLGYGRHFHTHFPQYLYECQFVGFNVKAGPKQSLPSLTLEGRGEVLNKRKVNAMRKPKEHQQKAEIEKKEATLTGQSTSPLNLKKLWFQ